MKRWLILILYTAYRQIMTVPQNKYMAAFYTGMFTGLFILMNIAAIRKLQGLNPFIYKTPVWVGICVVLGILFEIFFPQKRIMSHEFTYRQVSDMGLILVAYIILTIILIVVAALN